MNKNKKVWVWFVTEKRKWFQEDVGEYKEAELLGEHDTFSELGTRYLVKFSDGRIETTYQIYE